MAKIPGSKIASLVRFLPFQGTDPLSHEALLYALREIAPKQKICRDGPQSQRISPSPAGDAALEAPMP